MRLIPLYAVTLDEKGELLLAPVLRLVARLRVRVRLHAGGTMIYRVDEFGIASLVFGRLPSTLRGTA